MEEKLFDIENDYVSRKQSLDRIGQLAFHSSQISTNVQLPILRKTNKRLDSIEFASLCNRLNKQKLLAAMSELATLKSEKNDLREALSRPKKNAT